VEAEPDPDAINAHRDAGYRALGHYIAEFSSLIREMRERMESHFRRPDDPPYLVELIFAGATAEPVTHAFFAMCRMLMEHAKDETTAATRLRVAIFEEIKTRNLVAHGDWFIGYWSTTGLADEGHTAPEPIPAWADRINAARQAGPLQSLTEDLNARADELVRLRKMVREYGAVCFGQHGPQRAGENMRVRDVLLVENGVPVIGPKAVPGTPT
jgi:hypothetical protein